MALTGNQLLTALSQFLDDDFRSTTTSGGTTTTVIDTTLQRFGDKANEEAYVRQTTESAAAGNLNQVRRVTQFIANTLTVAPAFPQIVATAMTYEVHRYDPAKKFDAIDRARILAFPQVAQIVVDETITSDGISAELTIPSAIRRGPAQVWYEMPLSPTVAWNVLANPALTSLTSWTVGSGVTAAIYARSTQDQTVPRLESTCIKITNGATNGLSQVVAVMSITAANAAGRRFTFGAWVYSRTAGCTVTIQDNAATATSATHGGAGWQFLQVSRNISGSNTTLLTVSINPVTNNAVFAERAYFGAVDRISLDYVRAVPRRGVQRDDTNAILYLKHPAPRGCQYRLVGRSPVSALGSTLAAQATNSMEVAEADEDLLITTAARYLLTREGMSSDAMEKSFPQIKVADDRFKELQEDWRRNYPRSGYVESWLSG